MKKFNQFVETYLMTFFSIFLIEIIFRGVSELNVLSLSLLRVILGINIVSILFAFIFNNFNKLVRNIACLVLCLAFSVYAFLQAGFYNFIGVYMSFQTSSQLGAVVDYIRDFLLSFELSYYLTFVPFIGLLAYIIISRKKVYSKIDLKKSFAIFILVFNFSTFFYYKSVTIPAFQSVYQTTSNYKLFWTVSNPSLAIDQFGTSAFAALDIRQMLFPIEIEDEYISYVEEDNADKSKKRIIDDTALDMLINDEEDTSRNALNKYFKSRSITSKNDMTGLFKNKNLIVIMMESANDILLNEKYYPNFNKMVNNGWYFENNYSPRNSCSTMNNEFSGITSLYSIHNTCTASKYKKNTYFESMFNLFNKTGYKTFSAHNYTEAYYPRKTIHTNLGSGKYYGVQKLGISYRNEYRNWSDDDDFMKSVLKLLDKYSGKNKKKHFMTWLTTVSSHQPYGVSSIQGDRYYSMTSSNLPSDVKRYMSKLKILDKGLGVLLDGLKKRKMLDDTVIVLYGDHYPYGISTSHLNKVLPYNTKKDSNTDRVPLVIYNPKIKHEVYSDYTTFINILPTIANLFDLDYDPRLYLGEDYFSENYQSLAVFADGSWKNEYAYYNAKKSTIKYYTSFEYSKEEIAKINNDINTKMNISSKVIKTNYFAYLDKNLKSYKEKQSTVCPITE